MMILGELDTSTTSIDKAAGIWVLLQPCHGLGSLLRIDRIPLLISQYSFGMNQCADVFIFFKAMLGLELLSYPGFMLEIAS